MRRPPRHEDRVAWLAVGAAAVPAAIALPLLWTSAFELKTRVTLTLVLALGATGFVAAAYGHVLRPLQALANLIAALREGDYSMRGRHDRRDDALGIAVAEVNALGLALRAGRHADVEAAAILTRVIAGLDVAVLVFDRGGAVRLANPAAERLLAVGDLAGRDAAALGIGELLRGEAPRTSGLALPGGPWQLQRSAIRLEGVPHELVVLTDVRRALRDEERLAWQRLVRVLGHEINNSLGPIGSIAATLRAGLAGPRPADLDDDLTRGLEVIERRSAALARFLSGYARLTRLPPPRAEPVEVTAWIERCVALETRRAIERTPGPPATVLGDPDQLDQLLINLLANAVEAAVETDGAVRVGWRLDGDALIVEIEDEGPGVPPSANLFVPFFTTKPGGSGIGLALARQIAEGHGGALELAARAGGGARAVIRLRR